MILIFGADDRAVGSIVGMGLRAVNGENWSEEIGGLGRRRSQGSTLTDGRE